jgi:hypothetical protein
MEKVGRNSEWWNNLRFLLFECRSNKLHATLLKKTSRFSIASLLAPEVVILSPSPSLLFFRFPTYSSFE